MTDPPLASTPTVSAITSPGGAHLSTGLRHLVASAFFFSAMGVLVKVAGARLPSSQIALVRAVVCLVLSWLWLRRVGVRPWGSSPRMLILRGLVGTVGLVCLYYSLVTLPIAESVVIAHTAPIFTAILAALLLGEPAHRRLVAAIACCAVGVLAIARPASLFGGDGAALDPTGVAIGFLGAFSSSCVFVLIRRIRRRENPLVVVFYFPLVAVPILVPFAAAGWLWPTPLEWLVLLGVGVATQLAQVHMTRGLVLVPAARATAVGYIQVVLAALWGALFFGEIPDLMTLAGCGLILTATLALALSGLRRRARGEEGIVPR